MKSIIALGEVLWDVFPDGPKFGGAPVNFASACAKLSSPENNIKVSLISAVGKDDLGQQAINKLKDCKVNTSNIVMLDYPTGQVIVTLDESKNASYRFIENPAWDYIPISHSTNELVKNCDVICFGTLAQRSHVSRSTIQKLVSQTSDMCLRILDINLRTPYYSKDIVLESLSLANILKLNDEELPILAEYLDVYGSTESILRDIQKRYSLKMIALTCGANGSKILGYNGEYHESASLPVKVVDTVGAGDAFTAAVALGVSKGMAISELNRWANSIAAYVCTESGGTPDFHSL